MNNEQNNLNGLFNPILSSNLTPLGQNPGVPIQNNTTLQPNMNMSINPIPGTVTENSNNGLPPLNSNNIIPINNNSIIPETTNAIPNNNVNEVNNNLNIDNPSPFDIGLNSTPTPNNNNQIITPTIPTNMNNQPFDNNINVSSNTNSNDNTPLTNVDNNNNEKVVTVKEYLIYSVLCCIPVIGLIIMLMKAFGGKANKNISNLAKAQLLLSVIMSILIVLVSIILTLGYVGLNKNAIDRTKEHINNNYNNYDYNNDYSYNFD